MSVNVVCVCWIVFCVVLNAGGKGPDGKGEGRRTRRQIGCRV